MGSFSSKDSPAEGGLRGACEGGLLSYIHFKEDDSALTLISDDEKEKVRDVILLPNDCSPLMCVSISPFPPPELLTHSLAL